MLLQLSFLAVCHLIDFGSGYDDLLLAKTRRDAREAAQYAAIGLHLHERRLDAAWMAGFGPGRYDMGLATDQRSILS
jgi:hypothetical protein